MRTQQAEADEEKGEEAAETGGERSNRESRRDDSARSHATSIGVSSREIAPPMELTPREGRPLLMEPLRLVELKGVVLDEDSVPLLAVLALLVQ